MAKSPVRFVVLAAALAVLSGCVGAPADEPTYSCTPEAGGTPSPCRRVQFEESSKRLALYAEAEAVYRKYLAEDERIWRAGGVSEATAVMQETLTGPALSSALNFYQALGSTHTKLDGGESKLVWVKRVPDEISPGMLVALQACVDQHTASLVSEGEPTESGGYFSDTINFSREGGVLKIHQLSQPATGEVESC
jgi:hypothetical protein